MSKTTDENAPQTTDAATELRERVLMAEAQVKLAVVALTRGATRKAVVLVESAASNLKVAADLVRRVASVG